MGHRVTQRIYTCSQCGLTPDDGEYLWEMSGEYWCRECCESDDAEPPELKE